MNTTKTFADPTGAAPLPHVLIVDDDDLIRGMIQLLLEPYGFSVSVATNGDEVVRAISHPPCPVDVILLDMHIGKENGLSVFSRIHALAPTTKVVFLSGLNPPPEITQLCAQRKAWFMPKPFKGEDLVTVLAKAIVEPAAPHDKAIPVLARK
jgi:DNA-binding NtrC family response regulator